MLTGAADEAQANAGLRWATDLADASAQRLANIACWAFHLYPSDSPGPIRIQPDKLHDIPVGRRAAGWSSSTSGAARWPTSALTTWLRPADGPGRAHDRQGAVTALVNQVMTTEPYASARRVFWVADNGSSHAGRASMADGTGLACRHPGACVLAQPGRDLLSVIQRKVIKPADFGGRPASLHQDPASASACASTPAPGGRS